MYIIFVNLQLLMLIFWIQETLDWSNPQYGVNIEARSVIKFIYLKSYRAQQIHDEIMAV